MGRFVPITFNVNVAEKAAPTVPGAKAYYDGKQCWQYKVVYDRPGTYTWTAPSNAICVRTVLVGGGGKPKCGSITEPNGSTCSSTAGAGGAYSEKCHAITPGVTSFSLVVGRQEQDSTLACNSVNVHTAGGAAGCIPGVATGGDHNSRGGCAGYTCNFCGSSFSHFCGSCKCFATATCCGYCVVMQFDPAGVGASACCNIILAGGGSAGSPRALCGGCSSIMCGNCFSGIAGGGAGIADQCVPNVWHYPCCSCICFAPTSDTPKWCIAHPTSVQGGGGTLPRTAQQCRSTPNDCTYGIWKSGDGSQGGPDPMSGEAWTVEWGYSGLCAYPFGVQCWSERDWRCTHDAPCRVDWWDITDICGTGSPGTGFQITSTNCVGGWKVPGPRPKNAGEGAGTGGILTFCCNPNGFGNMISNTGGANAFSLVNWCKLCQLGLCNQTEQAWLMPDSLFPTFITCAGTLGGSGGVGWCGYTSKAGKGGGGGHAKCQFMCVCWGGSFDCCNGVAATPLAFPPCLLDQLLSNAGTGMAIIYYREA
jgi:hypothetical protein